MFRVALLLFISIASALTPAQERIVAKASRYDSNGWIHLTLTGSPYEVGFQHGVLIAQEFEAAWVAYEYFMYETMGMTLQFFNQAAVNISQGKIPGELLSELKGIADGLTSVGVNRSLDDIIGWNANTEITGYWWPSVASNYGAAQAPSSYAKAHCSAFVATGSATVDGKPVIGHQTFTEFWNGQYMNVVLDITVNTPGSQRIIMQGSYGWVASMTDFWLSAAGIAVVETTLAGFVGYDVNGIPEWVRARTATQFATSVPEWIQIMQKGNNGGYANSWLLADLNSGLIARFEQGLRYQNITYSTDGYFYGDNVAADARIRNLECVDTGFSDVRQQTGARRTRWPQLLSQYNGKIDVEVGQTMLGDTYDPYLKKVNPSSRCICAHYDVDPMFYVSDPGAVWNVPYTPAGSVDGKVTNAELGLSMNISVIFGRADGVAFDAPSFLTENPQWNWQAPYLQSRPSQPWTLF